MNLLHQTDFMEDNGNLQFECPNPVSRYDTVRMAHGGGGRLMQELIHDIFLRAFENQHLITLNDSAILPPPSGRLAFTTDSYVIRPLFFPGGDIGSLAVHGTVNDLAMSGARPHYLSAGFILEEGLEISTLQRVADSMAKAARACGVQIVCGDTKVVDRGKGDLIFINTAGIGIVPSGVDIGPHRIQSGDRIIVSGDLGSHGIAVLSVRESLSFSGDMASDSAPLHEVVADLIKERITIHCLRDLTRGGLTSALHELAQASNTQMTIEESNIPINDSVRGACELLGLDPLYVANEGRFIMFLPAQEVNRALTILRKHTVSQAAMDIGEVQPPQSSRPNFPVVLQTPIGTSRILDLLSGEQLPRIC